MIIHMLQYNTHTYIYINTNVMAVLNATRPTQIHRVMDMSSILFSWTASQENPVFQYQSEAFFPNIGKQQVTEDGETMRRENTGTHGNRERLCLAGLLSKSFQSQKPINILSSFTLLTLLIYQQALVKRTGFFLAIFICTKEACPQHLCTQPQSVHDGVSREELPREYELSWLQAIMFIYNRVGHRAFGLERQLQK